MRAACLALAAALLVNCGYVGDPLPPALHIPERVTDLSVVQRGDRIEIRFTAPALTTEALPIREFDTMDVRIGPVVGDFSFENWSATARPIAAPLPNPGDAVQVTIPGNEWTDREVLVAVRFTSRRGRESQWSNSVLLTPRAPLAAPVLRAESHPEGVRLSWTGGQVRIFRAEELIATTSGPEYIDRATEVGKSYSYTAQAVENLAESAVSAPVSITLEDRFAPNPPASPTAVVGLDSVELAWEPNTERDLEAYRVYRASGSADFAVLADAVETPAFSDRTAEASTSYRYRVTALDRAGNESAPSATVQVSR